MSVVAEEDPTEPDLSLDEDINMIVLDEEDNLQDEPLRQLDAQDNLKNKLTQLPMNRIKCIMKLDRDCTLVNKDVLFLLTKATELFIEYAAKEAHNITKRHKKKTVQKADLEEAILENDNLSFLEGTL